MRLFSVGQQKIASAAQFVKNENVITQKFHQKCQMGNKNIEFDADLKFVVVVSK